MCSSAIINEFVLKNDNNRFLVLPYLPIMKLLFAIKLVKSCKRAIDSGNSTNELYEIFNF